MKKLTKEAIQEKQRLVEKLNKDELLTPKEMAFVHGITMRLAFDKAKGK